MRRLLIALAASTVSVAAHAATWTNPLTGHSYQSISHGSAITWTQAKVAAETLGGYLVTITDAFEQSLVYSMIANDATMWLPVAATHGPWIGLFQASGSPEPSGGWQWVTGEAYSYTNWLPGEPNNEPTNSLGNEAFGHFHGNWGPSSPYWNDTAHNGYPNAPVASYIVEIDPPPPPPPPPPTAMPEPSSAALLATFGVWHLIRQTRRRYAQFPEHSI